MGSARTQLRVAKISYPFLIANAKYFNACMALYLYAKTERGASVSPNSPVGFNLEQAAALLNIKRRTMYDAYATCLDNKWFTEINRECYWVEVVIRD